MEFRNLRHAVLAVVVVLISFFTAGCGLGWKVTVEGKNPPTRRRPQSRRESHHEEPAPRIPPGHMPPPGKCRIWYPDTPPGHQPPPGDCNELRRKVPAGAWLIKG